MSTYTDSSHLSSLPSAEHLEEFNGMVETQFAKASIMRGYANIQRVTGTDTLINRRVGKTKLKKVTAGVAPKADQTTHGRASVTVDTIVLARDIQDTLNDFQADFNVRSILAEDQGKELGKFFDTAFIIMGIKGSLASAPTDVDSIGAGKSTTLAASGDESDPDKLEDAIAGILVEMQEEDIDTSECVIFVRPTEYRTLYKHDKLVDRDFSTDNGDFANGTVSTLHGSRIVSTARIPTAAESDHYLSNAANGNAYDVSATEAKSVAVILHPKSLLAGETIPLTGKIWYNDEDLSYYVDSYMAFGVAVNRPDVCGTVMKV